MEGGGNWSVIGCKLAEEMESGECASVKKVQVQRKMGPLIYRVSVHRA